MGVHRTVSPPDDELIKLGEELLEWVYAEGKDEKPIIFQEFYSMKKKILRKDWKTIIQRAAFMPYYEEAQGILAKRAMDSKCMDKSFGHRYLRLYDRNLIEEENAQAKEDAKIKAEALIKEAQALNIRPIDYSKAEIQDKPPPSDS